MSAAGFWDNQERAQQVVAELKAVKGIVKPLEEAEASTGDLMAMLELADEDPSFEPEVRREIARLEKAVDEIGRAHVGSSH